jgi:hypothetical protein
MLTSSARDVIDEINADMAPLLKFADLLMWQHLHFFNFKNCLTEKLMINVIHEVACSLMVHHHSFLVPRHRLIVRCHVDHM